MGEVGDDADLQLSRREMLIAAGLAGGGAGMPLGADLAAAAIHPPDAASPPVSGLHLQFGKDPSSEMTVSWFTLEPISNGRVLLGRLKGHLEQVAKARSRSYTDAKSRRPVYAHHALLKGLRPASAYMYAAIHDGTSPEFGTFRTSPVGRASFSFTSFGDQGTPTVAKKFVPPSGLSLPRPVFVNDNLGSPAAGDTTLGVERLSPLFHLFNGDLCYGNLADDRVRSWSDFWANNTRSARNRPWMPCPGNHEIESGNGSIGYSAYQTFFELPASASHTNVTRGLWYSFVVGTVCIISLANDDVAYQDAGDLYVRGYSKGRQKAWLEAELASARGNPGVDWIIVCMHQPAISTADKFNGAELGVREEWLPLFDRYGVDLTVCGHEHHYERSHPVRGRMANETLTPKVVSTRSDVIDTTNGTVHMVIGGGGTSVPSNELFFKPPRCRVVIASGEPDAKTGKRPPIYKTEAAAWSAFRDADHAYGFVHFAVEPGLQPGAVTQISAVYYAVELGGELKAVDRFALRKQVRGPTKGAA